nr:hypothetical protein [Mycoplasmopsis bovis]
MNSIYILLIVVIKFIKNILERIATKVFTKVYGSITNIRFISNYD